MARSQSSLKSLCVLGRRIFCPEIAQTADPLYSLPCFPKGLQTLAAGEVEQCFCSSPEQRLSLHADAGLHHVTSATHQTTLCPASLVQHLMGSPFAASSLQQSRHHVPIISPVQLFAQRQPHQITVVHYDAEEDTFPTKPQSIGSIAKYGDADVNLTKTIILTPTREVNKIIVPPAVVIPLRADS